MYALSEIITHRSLLLSMFHFSIRFETMFFRLFFLLNLAKIGHCFDDGEKFFRIKSYLSQEFSEFCIQLNETSVDLNETTTDALFIGSCEDDEGSQLWNVDSHSRMHNYIPKFRAGCIFNVNDTLVYEKDCSSPTNGLHKQFAKFNYNLFDDKIMNGYRAMHIKGTVKTGSPIIMQKPKPTRIQQNWKLDFVPLPEQIKLVDQRCQEFGPCGICTGDCGADHDCAEGLRCAQRNHDNNREDVPGCFWGEDSDRERYLDNDYCKFELLMFKSRFNVQLHFIFLFILLISMSSETLCRFFAYR